MNDFFADLEAQLRAAHGRRPSRTAQLARPAAVAASLAVVAGAAVAIAIALGGGAASDRPARPAPPHQSFAVPTTPVPPPSRADHVALLNGTTQPGLGRSVASRMAVDDFSIAIVTNAPRKDVATTRVFFRPAARRTALAAAARLRVKRIEPLTRPYAVVGGRDADVVVLLGADARYGLVAARGPAASSPMTPAAGAAGASGTATVLRGARLLLSFRGAGLRRGGYGVWVTAAGRDPRFLGFTPRVGSDGTLEFRAPVPPHTPSGATLLLTRESAGRPTRPGDVVLQGQLRFP